MGTNWFMPALVNSRFGLSGMRRGRGDDGVLLRLEEVEERLGWKSRSSRPDHRSCRPLPPFARSRSSAIICPGNAASPRSRRTCAALWRRSFRRCSAWSCRSMTVASAATIIPLEVRFEIAEQDLPSYLRAADFLNITDVDVVCVEHEFGIFGGPAGSHVLALLRELRMPIVTTLAHRPARAQRGTAARDARADPAFDAAGGDERTRRGISTRSLSGARPQRLISSRTAFPTCRLRTRIIFKDEFGVAGKQVLLTFGSALAEQGHRVCVARAAGHSSGNFPTSFTSCWARRIRICCATRARLTA